MFYAGFDHVGLTAASTADTINFNSPGGSTFLLYSQAGDDIVNVNTLSSGYVLSANTQAGNDTLNLGGALMFVRLITFSARSFSPAAATTTHSISTTNTPETHGSYIVNGTTTTHGSAAVVYDASLENYATLNAAGGSNYIEMQANPGAANLSPLINAGGGDDIITNSLT